MHERNRIKMEVAIIRALLDEAEREHPLDPSVNAQLVEELRRLLEVVEGLTLATRARFFACARERDANPATRARAVHVRRGHGGEQHRKPTS